MAYLDGIRRGISCKRLNLEELKAYVAEAISSEPKIEWDGIKIQRLTEAAKIWYIGVDHYFTIDLDDTSVYVKIFEGDDWQLKSEFNWLENGTYRTSTGQVFEVKDLKIMIPGGWFEDPDHESDILRKVRHFFEPRKWYADGSLTEEVLEDQVYGYTERSAREDGPFGGAFRSWDDYYRWRDPSLYR